MGVNYLVRFMNNELKPIISKDYWREDIIAAIAVTMVAIPLSLAISLATGVSAEVGLISAIIGGILGAIFGGCRLAITGPAVAMSVLIATVLQDFGFAGVLVCGLICGSLQILFGILKLGRFAKSIPLSLVLAFTAGIGFLLFFEQLPLIFQVAAPKTGIINSAFNNLQVYLNNLNSANFLLAILTLLILAFVPRFLPRAYSFFFAVLIPTALAYWLKLPVAVVGPLPSDLLHPHLVDFALIENWPRLFLVGVEIFILASLETLLSSNAVDLMGKGDLHNPNQELVGQGIANLGVALCGGIPVTGVVARSSVNVLAGAKTRRSAILQALMILAIVYLFPQLMEQMPLSVLSGILLAAACKMMNIRQVFDLWKSDRLEVLVYFITFLAIIATDLVDGIQTGLLAAFIIVGIRMLNTKTQIKLWTNNDVLRVGLAGNISFFSYEKLANIKDHALTQAGIHVIIFEFAQLNNLDSNGAKHLISIAQDLTDSGIKVIFHSLSDEQQKTIAACTFNAAPYQITITEYQIKAILEDSGFHHSATDILRHGIVKYITHYAKDNQQLLSTLAKGQKPHTLLITCADSRLNPNAFFSANLGEIFIIRNVGNVVPPFMPENIYGEIAAIEYAIAELEIRNIVLCGHTECGAIKASIQTGDNALGYVGLDNWLSLIKAGFKQHKPSDAFDGVKINLLHQVDNLKTYPAVSELLQQEKLIINAWIYDVHSGYMLEWVEQKRDFVPISE